MRLMLNTEEALTRFGNDVDLYKELASMFLEQTQFSNDKLLDYLKHDKKQEASSAVHMLKGLSGTLGAELLYDACIIFEQVIKGLKKGNLEKQAKKVTELFDETKQATIDYLNS